MSSDDLGSQERPAARTTFRGLRKHEAQQVYTICQAQEQSWREKRRVRDLDELRAQSGGIQSARNRPRWAVRRRPSPEIRESDFAARRRCSTKA